MGEQMKLEGHCVDTMVGSHKLRLSSVQKFAYFLLLETKQLFCGSWMSLDMF
ncbi:unnamed protein product [Meloidogyne enterolobii]|uniref:Uncharacterized protein n=1 Tax=Meloidogyne enterolobii TaxID=390850 RepID=A0ACB1A8M1_MELEN